MPKAVGLSVDSLLRSNKGNGNGGNSVRKGVSFTPPTAGLMRDMISRLLVPSWAKRSRFVGWGEIKNPRHKVGDFEVYLKNKGKT